MGREERNKLFESISSDKNIKPSKYLLFSKLNCMDNTINHITDDESILYKDTKVAYNSDYYYSIKRSGLNLIELIASKINPDYLKILSFKRSQGINISTVEQFVRESANKDSTISNLNNPRSEALQNPSNVVNSQRIRGAIPVSLIKNNSPLKNLSINDSKLGENNLSTNSNLIQKFNTNIYTHKEKIKENMTGILNYSFFNENNDFAYSIIKNRFLINDINKKAKKIINLNNNLSDLFLDSRTNMNLIFKNNLSLLAFENINKLNDIEINSYITKFKKNLLPDNLKIISSNLFMNLSSYENLFNFIDFNNERDGIVLKKNFILKNENLVTNESYLKINVKDIQNNNTNDFIDVSKKITENDLKGIYENSEISSLKQHLMKNISTDLKHFSNTFKTFDFILEHCKRFINENLTKDDADNNFEKRANITETATLLWSLSEYSKEINDVSLIKNTQKNKLIDILLYYFLITSKNRLSDFQKDQININKLNLIEYAMTPELISDLSGFYVYSKKLMENDNNYSNYDPFTNSQSTYDQDGLFYHFLMSNVHQKNYYKTSNDGSITQFDNNYNPLNFIMSNTFFYGDINENSEHVFIKNIFKTGLFSGDFRQNQSGLYDGYTAILKQFESIFFPYIEYSIINDKPSFIISLNSNDLEKVNTLKDSIKLYLNELKVNINKYTNDSIDQLRNDFFNVGNGNVHYVYKNLEKILINIDEIVKSKNIFNISTVDNSFLNNTSSTFLHNFTNELFDFPLFKNLSLNLSNVSFQQFENIKDNQILNNMRSILDSSLNVCCEFLCKMYVELQAYNSLSNRIFDAGFFKNGFYNSAFEYTTSRYPVIQKKYSIYEAITFLNTMSKENNNFSNFKEEDISLLKNFYTNKENNEFIDNFDKSELEYHSRNEYLKPSEQKLLSFLKIFLGINRNEVKKIIGYIRSKPELSSKNINIFELFNLYPVLLKNIINFNITTNENNEKILDMSNDISTFTYDFLYEKANILFSNGNNNNMFNSTGKFKSINLSESSLTEFIDYKVLPSYYTFKLKDNNYESILNNSTFNSYISLNDIFNYIICSSYNLNKEYMNIEESENKQISGCKNIEENSNNTLDLIMSNHKTIKMTSQNDLRSFKQILESVYGNNYLTFNNCIDLSNNWYNQIAKSLLINDLSHIMNMEYVLYNNQYKGIGYDSYNLYQVLSEYRKNNKNNSNSFTDFTTESAVDFLQNQSNYKNLILKNNNFNLKYSYLKNFFNAKKLKNLYSLYVNNENLNETINTQISNDKLLLINNFKDFYFDKFFLNNNTITSENCRLLFSNNLLSRDASRYFYLNNNAIEFLKSTILTIGIENKEEIIFEDNDILLITVEMIDHDFPELLWHTKSFTFDMSIDDPFNEIIEGQIKSLYQTTDEVENISTNNLKIDIPLTYNLIDQYSNNNILAKFIENENDIESILNTDTTNIEYNPKKLSTGFISKINYIFESRKSDLKNKFKKIKILNNLSEEDYNTIISDLVKKCIYNQKTNFKLKHISKLITGFDTNIDFSLKENKELQNIYVLSEVYDLFVNLLNINAGIENDLNIDFEDLEKAFCINGNINFEKTFELLGYNFKIANMTNNQNINSLIKFMSDFTKSIVPDFSAIEEKSFRKIINIAVNPSDFVICNSVSNERIPLIIDNQTYTFEEIILPIKDELNNLYDLLNTKILENYSITQKFYKVKVNGQDYIPKNVSYRIKVDILD